MTSPLVTAARAAIRELEAHAESARNRADRGDSSALETFWNGALKRAHARVLADPSARDDLRAEAPALVASLDGWIEIDYAAEAQWRVRQANLRIDFGPKALSLGELEHEGTHRDPERRSAAWKKLDRAIAPDVRHLPRPADASPEPESNPTETTAGGLILPSSAVIAAVAAGMALTPDLVGEPVDGSEGADNEGSDHAEIWQLASLLRALAEATDQSITGFGGFRRAVAGVEGDFRLGEVVPHRPAGLERAGLPWARGGQQNLPARGSARRALAELGLVHGWSWAAIAPSAPFCRWGFGYRTRDLIEVRRRVALAFGGLLFEAWLGAQSEDFGTELEGFGVLGVPASWAKMAGAEARWARSPGEGRAIYPRSEAMLGGLLAGVSEALWLREAVDEDWFRVPDRAADALRRRGESERVGVERVCRWLRESADL